MSDQQDYIAIPRKELERLSPLYEKYWNCRLRHGKVIMIISFCSAVLALINLFVSTYYQLKFHYVDGMIMGAAIVNIIYGFFFYRIHKKHGL